MTDFNKTFPPIVFISGASGVGKTTVIEAFKEKEGEKYHYLHFDSVGVPSLKVMESQYGSGRGWQRAMLFKWAEIIKEKCLGNKWVLFEGQYDLEFVDEVITKHGIKQYIVVVLYVNENIQKKRLIEERNQPELHNPHMINWSNHLRNQAIERGYITIDSGFTDLNSTIRIINDAVIANKPVQVTARTESIQ